MYSFTNIVNGVPTHDCSQIIIKSLERIEHQEYILVWILFVNSLMAILTIGFLVVNFPEYNYLLLERRAKLEMNGPDSTILIDNQPFLVGLDYTRSHEKYHRQHSPFKTSSSTHSEPQEKEALSPDETL